MAWSIGYAKNMMILLFAFIIATIFPGFKHDPEATLYNRNKLRNMQNRQPFATLYLFRFGDNAGGKRG
jgi:hypothetical protein